MENKDNDIKDLINEIKKIKNAEISFEMNNNDFNCTIKNKDDNKNNNYNYKIDKIYNDLEAKCFTVLFRDQFKLETLKNYGQIFFSNNTKDFIQNINYCLKSNEDLDEIESNLCKRLLVSKYTKNQLENYCNKHNIKIDDDDIEINYVNKIINYFKSQNNIELYYYCRNKDLKDLNSLILCN